VSNRKRSWRFQRTSRTAQLDNWHEHFRRTLDRTRRRAILSLSLVLSDPFAQKVCVHAMLQRQPGHRHARLQAGLD
jgi:hypothetical protein